MINTVEVEVNSHCNRRCSYCPVSVLPLPSVPRLMPDYVMERLLDELVRIGFAGRFSYHFYSEPLLRHDLEQLVVRVTRRIPSAFQVLYTNGDLLTDERYKSLLSAGINHFQVTSHSLMVHPERPFQTILFPKDLELSNRGGLMSNKLGVEPEVLSVPCYAPSEMLIVTVTGDVLLCYEDVKRRYVMGNIIDSSLETIWLSKPFVRTRMFAAEGMRIHASGICGSCNNKAHQAEGTSYRP